MTDQDHGTWGDLEVVDEAPTVFISYRRDDTRDVAATIAARLREDLGSTNVFRDEEDLIGGQRWEETLRDAIAGSDSVLFLIGDRWTGPASDGSRRIDDAADVVRNEVRHALQRPEPVVSVPILVDLTAPPAPLPDEVGGLFRHHCVTTTRADLEGRASADYQAVLVSVWDVYRSRRERGVIVVGSTHAGARIEALVGRLRTVGAIEARTLSRFASGAVVLSARRARRGRRRWPQVIVVVEEGDEDDDRLRALVAALSRHPAITSVALVTAGTAIGATAALTALASEVSGSGTTATTYSEPELIAVLPDAGTGVPGTIGTAVANTTTATKAAIVGGAIVATVGIGAILLPKGEGTASIEFPDAIVASVADNPNVVQNPVLYPLGPPVDAVVALGPAEPVGDRGDLVQRAVSVRFGDSEPVELDVARLPTELPAIEGAAGGRETFTVAEVRRTVDLPIAGMPASDFCVDENDPSVLLAGWRFTGGLSDLTVTLVVFTEASEPVGTGAVVRIEGPAAREPLPDTPADFRFGPDCADNGYDGDGASAALYSDGF